MRRTVPAPRGRRAAAAAALAGGLATDPDSRWFRALASPPGTRRRQLSASSGPALYAGSRLGVGRGAGPGAGGPGPSPGRTRSTWRSTPPGRRCSSGPPAVGGRRECAALAVSTADLVRRARPVCPAAAALAPTPGGRRSRRRCPPRSPAGTAEPGSRPSALRRLEHLVDDVDGRVGGLHVAAHHRGRLAAQRLVAGDGEGLPEPAIVTVSLFSVVCGPASCSGRQPARDHVVGEHRVSRGVSLRTALSASGGSPWNAVFAGASTVMLGVLLRVSTRLAFCTAAPASTAPGCCWPRCRPARWPSRRSCPARWRAPARSRCRTAVRAAAALPAADGPAADEDGVTAVDDAPVALPPLPEQAVRETARVPTTASRTTRGGSCSSRCASSSSRWSWGRSSPERRSRGDHADGVPAGGPVGDDRPAVWSAARRRPSVARTASWCCPGRDVTTQHPLAPECRRRPTAEAGPAPSRRRRPAPPPGRCRGAGPTRPRRRRRAPGRDAASACGVSIRDRILIGACGA